MNDADFFKEFKYSDWLIWLKAVIYNRPMKSASIFSEPMENILRGYNLLINYKANTDYFNNAIIEVLNGIPKQEKYSSELHTLLYVISYVKPVERADFLEFLFYGGTIANIFHEGINLNEMLLNILISFKNERVTQKLSSYFENGLYKIQPKTFYALALRNLYTNKRDDFFLYLNRLITMCGREIDVIDYVEVIVFILDEMCTTLKNYGEVVDWWIKKKKYLQDNYYPFCDNFLKISLKWLHKDNGELTTYMEALILKNVFLFDYYVLHNTSKPNNEDIISYIKALSSLHHPKEELIRYTTKSIAIKYENFGNQVREWFTEFTHSNKESVVWSKINNTISIIENISASRNSFSKQFEEKLFAK